MQATAAELFAKNTVLFAQVFNELKLALIYPSSKSNQDKSKWIEGYRSGRFIIH